MPCNFFLKNSYSTINFNMEQTSKNWTSGNHDVDKFIRRTQLKATCEEEFLE